MENKKESQSNSKHTLLYFEGEPKLKAPKYLLDLSESELEEILSRIWSEIGQPERDRISNEFLSPECSQSNLGTQTFKKNIQVFHRMLWSGQFDKSYIKEQSLDSKLSKLFYEKAIRANQQELQKMKSTKNQFRIKYQIINIENASVFAQDDYSSESTYDSNYEEEQDEEDNENGKEFKVSNIINNHRMATRNSIPSKSSVILSKVNYSSKNYFKKF